MGGAMLWAAMGLCACGLLGPSNPIETNPERPIEVRVGQSFELVTLWDGTHLLAADESVVEIGYDESIAALVEERSQSRQARGFGGLNLFYDIVTFRAVAPGETEIALYIPDDAWRDYPLTDRNLPLTFRVTVLP